MSILANLYLVVCRSLVHLLDELLEDVNRVGNVHRAGAEELEVKVDVIGNLKYIFSHLRGRLSVRFHVRFHVRLGVRSNVESMLRTFSPSS
jgi:hypothetical protein